MVCFDAPTVPVFFWFYNEDQHQMHLLAKKLARSTALLWSYTTASGRYVIPCMLQKLQITFDRKLLIKTAHFIRIPSVVN